MCVCVWGGGGVRMGLGWWRTGVDKIICWNAGSTLINQSTVSPPFLERLHPR